MGVRGSCLCGGMSFEIEQATGPAEYCHCTCCRKTWSSQPGRIDRSKDTPP
jgi:hypothetical protein